MTGTSTHRGSALSRWTRSQDEVDADRLQDDALEFGASSIKDCPGGCTVTVVGRLRSVTLRPTETAPVVEADLWDGTGRLNVVFLGRRRIPGITPGRHVVVHGRVIMRDGERSMVNPRYELLPPSAG